MTKTETIQLNIRPEHLRHLSAMHQTRKKIADFFETPTNLRCYATRLLDVFR